MAAGDIRAGKAYVELGVNSTVQKELDKAAKQLKAFGSSVTAVGKQVLGVGVAITAPLVLAAERFAAMGDQINKASERTGVSVENLSALGYAAEQSGASFEDFESGIRKMSKALFEAEAGSEEANKSLKSLGLNINNLKALSPDKQFVIIAEALSKVDDAGARAAISMQLFGKGGATLLPLVKDGAAGISALTKQAAELGLVMSKEDAEAATKFGDTLDDLWKQTKMVVFQTGAAVAQALLPFAEAARKIMTSVINWVKENRTLVISVLAIGAALVAAGIALVTLGTLITSIGAVITGVTAVVGFLGSAIALLANPVVLVGAALLALGAYILYATGLGGQALDWLSDKFTALKDIAVEAFSGIADALAAGDIVLAGQLIWTGLKLLWITGTQELQNKWTEFKYGFVRVAGAAFYGALEIYQNVKAAMLTAFENTTSFIGGLWDAVVGVLGDVWHSFANSFVSVWDNATDLVAKGMLKVWSMWDKTLDYAAAAKGLDDDNNRRAQSRQREEDARQNERQRKEMANAQARENERSQNVGQIERDKQAAIADINQREQSLSAGASAAAKQEIADLEKQRLQLQKELHDLRNKAGTEKAAKSDKPLPKADKMRSLDEVLASRQDVKVKAAGTFNAYAAFSLASAPIQERIAKATELTAKNTAKIANQKLAAFK